MEVVAEYEYEALHEDELTLHPGDVIRNVRCIEEDGWMEGELNGRRGLFPDNFVKELKKESKETKETKNEPKVEAKVEAKVETAAPLREKSSGNVANLVNRMSAIGIPLGGFQPHPPAQSKKPKKRQCKVLFDYQPQNEDELELKVGDIVDVTEEVEEGWWSGMFNGKSGLFPSNFVKELDTGTEDGESNEAAAEETDAPAATENASTPTSPPGSTGNGVLRPHAKVMGVGFGDIFAGAPLKLKPVPSVPSAKPAHPNHPTPTSTSTEPKADSDSRASLKGHTKEYCKVTFAFEATNEDELTLKEGDIIHVLSKDTGEPGWWRGEVGGKEGVFPDNFVTLVNDTDKDSGAGRGSLKSSLKQDHEQKPRKPPPPSKQSIVHKPEVPSADKKPHTLRSEDKVDKPTPEKHSKPAPLPPPKPTAPGKGRPSSHPPKRPEKPLAPSASLRHNGEMPSTRPKPDHEPSPVSKPRTPSVDAADKPSEPDLMSFDDLAFTSLKLSHPTADRPKMPGKRPPTMYGGQLPNKEVHVEKSHKADEEDGAKPKLTETKKPSISNVPHSPTHLRHSLSLDTKPASPAAAGGGGSGDGVSAGAKGRLEPEEQGLGLEELRSQMRELLLTVELLKAQQTKEMSELRGELDEERHKRVALQMEIEKLKRTVHLT